MLIRLLLGWLVIAVALGVTASMLDDVTVEGGTVGLLWVSALFGLVNAIVGPVLRLLSLPLTLVTFGLFALVVNAILFALTAGLSDYLDVGGFGWTIVAAFLVALISAILNLILMRLLAPDEAR